MGSSGIFVSFHDGGTVAASRAWRRRPAQETALRTVSSELSGNARERGWQKISRLFASYETSSSNGDSSGTPSASLHLFSTPIVVATIAGA